MLQEWLTNERAWWLIACVIALHIGWWQGRKYER